MQYQFHFVFPYPAGCLHVSESGSDGYGIDERARVCGDACALSWAIQRGKRLTGEGRVYSGTDGEMQFQCFSTKFPEEITRPSFAHLAALMRGS